MMCRLSLSVALFVSLSVRPVPAQDLAPPDRLDGPPIVSAKAWVIADGKDGKVLWGSNEASPLTIASTTKIMTAYLVLDLGSRTPKVLDETLTVTERAAKTGGSSAKIQAGERYLVRDLLYGLLLPSGNDAAVALAEHFGDRFRAEGDGEDDSLKHFVAEMNRRAAALKMTQTKYLDPHGNSRNQSSASDLATLAWNAMQNPLFRDYVRTRRHKCQATDTKGEKRDVAWENTNRLLGIEGYFGIKSGTTTAAGSCLVSSGRHGEDQLIVVVLGCTSNDSRYIDSRNLYRWAWLRRGNGQQ